MRFLTTLHVIRNQMEKNIHPANKFLAGISVILFVLTTGLALLLFNAERRLFDADLYIAALERQNVYERLPALAAESMMDAPAGAGPNSARSRLSLIPAQNWEALFRALLPAEVSRPMTEQALASIFDYLNGKSDTVAISLVEFKTRLLGPAGTEALLGILRSQPPCSFEQIAQLTIGSLFGQTPSFILCNPSDDLLNLFQPLIQSQIQAAASTIPDSVDLTPSSSNAQSPLRSLRALRTFMRLSPLLPLGLLLLAARRWQDLLTGWGIPLLSGGIFGAILSAAAPAILNWGFTTYTAPRLLLSLPTPIANLVHGLVTDVISGVAKPILGQSALLMLVGIILLVAAYIQKDSRQF